MVNLNSTFPLDPGRIGSAYELPVLVDLNWLGKVMTSPEAGIVLSREALRYERSEYSRGSLAPSQPSADDSDIIL